MPPRTGAAGFLGDWDRFRLNPADMGYPTALGSYNDMPNIIGGGGATLGDRHAQLYRDAGFPCRMGKNYWLREGIGHGSEAQPSTLTPYDPGGYWQRYKFSNNNLGVFWGHAIQWGPRGNQPSGDIYDERLTFNGCITPPEPVALWVDCPIEANDVSFSDRWGKVPSNIDPDTGSAPGTNIAGPVMKKLTKVANAAVGNATPKSWWYINNTQPIDISGKTWQQISESSEFLDNPTKRFSAWTRAAEKGLVNVSSDMMNNWGFSRWIKKATWENYILPCIGGKIQIQSNNPVNETDKDKCGPVANDMALAGNYTYTDNIDYVRCRCLPMLVGLLQNSFN